MSVMEFLPDQDYLNDNNLDNDNYYSLNVFDDSNCYNSFEHGSTGSPESDTMLCALMNDSALIANPLNDCELISNFSQFTPNVDEVQMMDNNVDIKNEVEALEIGTCVNEVPLIPDLEETIMNSYNSFWTNSNALSSFTSMQTDSSNSSAPNSQPFDMSSPFTHAGCSSSPIASPPDLSTPTFDPLSSPQEEDVKKPSRKRARTSKSSNQSTKDCSTAKDPNSTFFTIARDQLLVMSINEYEAFVSAKRLERQSANASSHQNLSTSLSSSNTTEAEEKDIRRQRRLIKNRESAQFSREKRKNKMQSLESTVSCLTMENMNLKNQVTSLQQKLLKLKSKLAKFAPQNPNPIKKEKLKSSQNMKHVSQVLLALAGFGLLYCYLVQGGVSNRSGLNSLNSPLHKQALPNVGNGGLVITGGAEGSFSKHPTARDILSCRNNCTTEDTSELEDLGFDKMGNGPGLINTTEVYDVDMNGLNRAIKVEVDDGFYVEEEKTRRRGLKRMIDGEIKQERAEYLQSSLSDMREIVEASNGQGVEC